jgi:Ca2+-binding RTX toxin-like protein
MATLTLTPGADLATFGTERDIVSGLLADLTIIDQIDFGDGAESDLLRLTSAGVIDFRSGGNASGMIGHERLELAAGTNTVFLTDAVAGRAFLGSANAGLFRVESVGIGDDTVDASLVTSAGNRILFLPGGGNDTFIGSSGADTIRINAADLTSGDNFNAGLSNADVIQFETSGAVDAAGFTNLRRIEQINLNAGGNSVTLTQAFAASSDSGRVVIANFGGNNTIVASAVTTAVQYTLGTGTDSYTGGSGIDTIIASTSTLQGTDTLTGGNGTALDVLRLSGGVYTADKFAGVTQFERIDLTVGGTEVFLALGMPATSTGTFAVIGTAGNDRVIAAAGETARVGFNPGAGSDRFLGGDGDDQINMRVEDLDATDIFNGGAGRDRIGFLTAGTITAAAMSGLSNIETFSLAEGNNTVTLGTNLPDVNVAGRGGNDTVTMALPTQFASLGGGDDTMIVTASSVPALSSYGGTGNDTIRTVGGGTFTFGALIVEFENLVMQDGATVDLTANLQALTITGSPGADILSLGAVGYTANMGAGNDIVINGPGNDVLDGGADFDVFVLGPGGGTVDLSITGPQDTGQGIDTIINFENAQGGTGGDVLIGDDNPNILAGGDGDDQIFGRGGADVLWGAGGNDLIDGGAGNDIADYRFAAGGIVVNLGGPAPQASNDGDGGQDTLVSIEYIRGSQFDDVIDGDAGNNRLWGEGGNDIIRGGAGDDILDGGPGDDTLDGQAGNDIASYESATASVNVSLAIVGPQNTGGAGTDTLSSIENLTGSKFNDQLFGNAGVNILRGGEGDDYLNGGAGADELYGDAGNDTLEDNDNIRVLRAGDGDDTGNLTFQSGTLSNTTNSWIQMGNGSDTLNLTFNSTTLQPNRGISTGSNTAGSGNAPDAVEAGDGGDTVNVSGTFNATGTYLLTMSGNDTVNMNTSSVFSFVHLGAGNDQYNGGNGADRVYGGADDDTLFGNGGNDFLDGGLGNDLIDGGAGNDTVSYSATATSATAGVTVDLAITTAQDTGGAGIDTILNVENAIGSNFNDVLFGDANVNRLEGGTGDDILVGRGGADTLVTGTGNDLVRYFAPGEGGDTVTDFTAGGANDAFSFLASAFPLFNGQSPIDIFIDNSAPGNLDPAVNVVGRRGVADAAAVDAYLAGANQTFAGGVFVLGQAANNTTVSLYYDPNAAVTGGANSAVLIATLQGVTSLSAFTPSDFQFFS